MSLLSDFETEYGAQLIGCTVIRILGEISARPSAASSTGSNPGAFFGILVDEANGDPPGPQSTLHADWMYWRGVYGLNRDLDPADEFDSSPQLWVPLDVRSSRKLDELNQDLYLSFESSNTYNVGVSLSVLLLLP